MPEALQVLTTLMITWADQDMSCLICIACLFLSFSKQVWVGSGRDAALLALQHAPHPVPLLGTHVIIVQAAQLQLTLILSLGLPAAASHWKKKRKTYAFQRQKPSIIPGLPKNISLL